MKKRFNTTGLCLPEIHYMADIKKCLDEICMLIDRGEYFTINRARQYGKTTILHALKNRLKNDYCVFSISFEGMEEEVFLNAAFFCRRLFGLLYDTIIYEQIDSVHEEIKDVIYQYSLINNQNVDFRMMRNLIVRMCQSLDKPIIFMIDEVDQASTHAIFLDFLGQIRNMYLNRMKIPAFHSVILAGVQDIKNIKLKIRPEGSELTNSPWNISADFYVDMSLSAYGIEMMLDEYEADHHTGMDIKRMTNDIYSYTSGYPFLVSRICKLIDENVKEWDKAGFLEAIRLLLYEENTLFASLDNKLIDYKELKQMLQELLFQGKVIEYHSMDKGIRMAVMFGFVMIKDGIVYIANRIFETRLYQMFLVDQTRSNKISQLAINEKNKFIINGQLDMEQIISRFIHHYTDLFGEMNEKFLEEDGRKIFLLFIRPIINGIGNYYIEAQTRDHRRTDVIIDYLGQQFIIELKIWHGEEYNQRGEEQLADYLNQYHLKRGYMVSFNFNKKKEVGLKKILIEDKVLIEAVV